MKKTLIICVFIVSGVCGFLFSLYTHKKPTPQNEVHMIETFHYPATFVKQLQGDPHAGEKIFKEFCASCHSAQPMINVNAPKINDQAAWKARKNMGMSNLLKITIEGAGAMPARGGCFECSDEQLRQTIQYILNQ